MSGGNFELVAIGNPLLDMQVRDGEAILKKVSAAREGSARMCARVQATEVQFHFSQYNLKSNDAILAGEEHMVRRDEK